MHHVDFCGAWPLSRSVAHCPLVWWLPWTWSSSSTLVRCCPRHSTWRRDLCLDWSISMDFASRVHWGYPNLFGFPPSSQYDQRTVCIPIRWWDDAASTGRLPLLAGLFLQNWKIPCCSHQGAQRPHWKRASWLLCWCHKNREDRSETSSEALRYLVPRFSSKDPSGWFHHGFCDTAHGAP